MTIWRASPADAEAIVRAAQALADADGGRPRASMPNRTKDTFTAFVQMLIGEWAVADDLGLERLAYIHPNGDGGVDLVAPSGHTLAVRYAGYATGRLMAFDNHEVHADVMILVVRHGHDFVARIAGATSTARFYEIAEPIDVGHGPSRSVTQRQLTAWVRARPRLL